MPKTYLDEQGNEITGTDSYLDEQGNELKTPSASAEIKAKHAKNVSAGAAAYKPSWTESYETGYKQGGSAMGLANVVGEAVKGAGDAFTGIPETISGMYQGVKQMGSELIDDPSKIVDLPGKIGAGLITGATEPLISPRTTGKALTEAGVTAGVAKGVGAGVGAAKEIISHAPQRALKQGTNQITAALHPSVRTSKALDNTQGDFFQYATKTGREIIDADSAASIFKDATDDFYKTNYQPLVKEIEAFDPSITKLLERRSEVNDTLGRLGYYDKHPIVQSAARTAPQTGALLDEVEAIRKSLNKTVDTLTPTNAGAANILRKYADMKQVSDMTRIKAERIGLAKKIKAGEQPTMGERLMDVGKDVAVSAGGAAVGGAIGHVVGGPAGSHIGAALGTVANPRLIKQMANIKGLKPDADALFARGFENWKKGSGAAAQPIPITRKPLPTPDERLQNAGGQIRYNPSSQSANALSPQFQPNPNLDPAVMEQWRAQAAQGPSRNLTIGEAASQGVDVPLSQTLKYQGYPGSAAIDETIERTTQFPLARSRPGERGSIRMGGPQENALSPSTNVSPERMQSALKKLEKTFFHGTREEFEGPLRGSQGRDLHQEGIWFAPNRGKDFDSSFISDATRYSGDYGRIISANLKLQNPYLGSVDDISSGRVTAQWLRENGYDGFIDDMSGSGLVAVLDPGQIAERGREVLGKPNINPTGRPLP